MTQVIEKTGFRTFKVFWQEKPEEILNMNFNPLVDYFSLANSKSVLLHWQAKPKGLRRFGVYDVLTDNYFAVDFDKLNIGVAKSVPLQIDEKVFTCIPTAVILYKGVSIHSIGEKTLAMY